MQWVWPSALSYAGASRSPHGFSESLVAAWTDWEREGDALELGHDLVFEDLPKRLDAYNAVERKGREPMPWLAALVASPIDLALHDAFGQSLGRPTYTCYDGESLAHDLGRYLEPAEDSKVRFAEISGGLSAFRSSRKPSRLAFGRRIGSPRFLGTQGRRTGRDYPFTCGSGSDGTVVCLKIKLRGNDSEWDYRRLLEVGRISAEEGVDHLTTDFNCTVTEPAYVMTSLIAWPERTPRLTTAFYTSNNPFPTTSKCIGFQCIAWPKGNPFLWTKALMIGSTSAWDGNWGGTGSPSRPARPKPGPCSRFAGPRLMG